MKKLTIEGFIEKSNIVHNFKYDYSKVIYENTDTNVEIICPEHGSFHQRPDHHLNGRNCKKCSVKSMKNVKRFEKFSNDFIERIKSLHGTEYDYSKVKYINAKTKVCIVCQMHGDIWMTPDSLLNGCKCIKCSTIDNANKQRDNNETFIKKAISIHKNTYDYSKVEYLGSKVPIEIICLKHGSFIQLPYNHLLGKGCPECPNCRNSKPEKHIEAYLTCKNITHIRQYRFNDCKNIKPLPFDFYLPDYNLCIEYDGQQHFKKIEMWGGINSLEKQQINDKIKTNYCINNNIVLLRINYTQNIDEVLHKYFN